MHSIQALKSTGRRGSESEGKYRMTHSLSMDEAIKTIPKTENSNIFTGIMNLFGSAVSKIPNFMSGINNSLSVTVLPNSTITSEDLLRDLTGSTEHLSSDNKFDLTSTNYTGLMSITSENPSHNNICVDQNIILQNTADWIKQFHNNQSNDLDIAIIESLKTAKENKYSIQDKTPIIDTMNTEKTDSFDEKICKDKFGVDEIIVKMNVPDSQDMDTEFIVKKSVPSRLRRKCNIITKSRRNKRGKLQLRKSGVSQIKHKKERIKQTLYSNIQDDLDSWKEKDTHDLPNSCNNDVINDRMSPISDDDDESDAQSSYEIIPEYPIFSDTYVIDDSKKAQNWKDKKNNKPDMLCELTIVSEVRPRSLSESSIHSADFSIVFEDGSDSEASDENETSDYESSSEDDDDDDETETESEPETNCKVRFNLQPIVHPMVKWNYAYRAARRGPWEQMARDSCRFRERIRNVGCTLDHVLSTQHRDCIWYERFAPKD